MEEVGEEERVEGGEGVSPRGEEGEVEGGDGLEAGGEGEEVVDVAAESQVGPGSAFQGVPFPADERGGVAAADAGDGGDDGGEEDVREVVEDCGWWLCH